MRTISTLCDPGHKMKSNLADINPTRQVLSIQHDMIRFLKGFDN